MTRIFLKNNPNVIILRADKGNVTVAINRSDYEIKMSEILNDNNTYKEVSKIPICTLQTNNNKLVNELFRYKTIDERTKNKLITYNAVSAKMYGTIKHHKPGFPVRPVVSTIGTAQANLSRWLSDILTEYMNAHNKYNIKNSYDLLEHLSNIEIEPNEIMVSYDVVSMFTKNSSIVNQNFIKKSLGFNKTFLQWKNELGPI